MKDPSRLYRWILLVGSLVTIGYLVRAAVRENFHAEWYGIQKEYRKVLYAKADDDAGRTLARDFRIELKQVSVPSLRAVDRCVSCHNGIDDPRMTEVPRPHAVHSGDVLRIHPPDRYGCTVCHQGQGSATNFHDAKAEDAYWDYPLLPRQLTHVTCVSCHDPSYLARVAPVQVSLLREGMRLYQEKSCASCHKIGGRGGTLGPALDNEGLKTKHQLILTELKPPHTTWRWHQAHFSDPEAIVPGSQMMAPNVSDAEALSLAAYMLSLRRRDVPESYLAPDKIEQKFRALRPEPMTGEQAYRSYCTACHLPQGQGSNFASLGVRSPAIGRPDFLDVATDQFILSTLQTGRPERKMPALAAPNDTLTSDEARSLVAFLRARAPRVPSLAEVERARPDRALGGQIYTADCAGCHGEHGQGTPLGSPLATTDRKAATRYALYRSLAEGVASTVMPRYSGYDPAQLRSLLDYVGSLPAVSGKRAGWRKGQGDSESGRLLFAKICAGCHGDQGQGKIGPALGSPGFQKAASEEFIAATVVRGRSGTPMPAFGRSSASYPQLTAQEVLDVAAFVGSGLKGKAEARQVAVPGKAGTKSGN